MASIASPLLQRRKEPDDEQLLKLFWNRAELKKELAQLRREKEKLLDQVKQQESANLRAQQRLEHLEAQLADPLQAVNAVIYYQLKGVWQQCRKRLLRLARELADRQQDREEQHARGRFQRVRDGELAIVDEKIAGLEQRAQVVDADLRTVQEKARQMRGFWNYFRRRVAKEQAAACVAVLEGLQSQIEKLRSDRRDKESVAAPEFAGLSIEGKRNINLAVIALAQQLLVHFAEHNVAGFAREASVRALSDVSYGTPAECRALSQSIEVVTRALDVADALNGQLRRRAEFLRLTAQYRKDGDTVPIAGSFASVPLAITDTGEPQPANERIIPVNVLADEYWDVYTVLLT